ncbi:MAG TPA: hydroxysqualene dehydroxylase HpnE [Jatrophihabitans sp.]|nr:hydroxysqualene dehydroxylase HpnE [Jatrophihabitans sp.]
MTGHEPSREQQRVAVVGGGLAGLTAALRLADAGRPVLLLEAGAKLGGLTHSFRRGELDVDNGQHVFLRCCEAYLRLLDRLGVRDQVTIQPRLDVPVRAPGMRPGRLRRNRLPAPLHLGGSLLRYPMLSPADRLRAVSGALAMRRLRAEDPAIDGVGFGDWLDRHGQNQRTVAALWDLFTVATLNLPAEAASLTMAAKVFQTGLLSHAAAGDIGWSLIPLQQLHAEPAARELHRAGAEIRTRSRVTELVRDGSGWLLRDSAGHADRVGQVVLAVPPEQAERLLPAGTAGLPAGWSARLGSSPIVNVHLVYDRQVLTEPFLAGVHSPVQWLFDRTRQSGLADGQYLAISLSAAAELIDTRTAGIRDRVLPALAELLPATRTARLVDFFVTRERHATFRAAPCSGRFRPPADAGLPGLALAGAWTATGWPATMESAVLSGESAANLLLAGDSTGSAGHGSRYDHVAASRYDLDPSTGLAGAELERNAT